MINLCKNSNEFLNICDKLKEVKGTRLTENILCDYMIAGLYNKRIFTFVSYNGKMNGCLILLLTKDQIGELTLVMLFTWIDAHYPKLHKDFIDIATQKAKELNAKKISIITNRSEKVIDRRIGKYGFKKTCSIFEKEVI
jgi:hypothetical protein